ncbi:MAG: hypothetical protein ABH821_04595, partial [archaeon]
RNFVNQLESSYDGRTPFFDGEMSSSKIKTMNFKSLLKFDEFLLNLLEKQKKQVNCSYWEHLRWPMLYARQEYQVLKEMKNTDKIFIVASGKTHNFSCGMRAR